MSRLNPVGAAGVSPAPNGPITSDIETISAMLGDIQHKLNTLESLSRVFRPSAPAPQQPDVAKVAPMSSELGGRIFALRAQTQDIYSQVQSLLERLDV